VQAGGGGMKNAGPVGAGAGEVDAVALAKECCATSTLPTSEKQVAAPDKQTVEHGVLVLELVTTIKVLIEKGDKAKAKAEQFYISAGQHLKTLKAKHDAAGGTWAEWEERLRQVGIGKSRASELMQIADGRKTVEQVRADKNETSKLAHRKARS